jgi:hypothetical protein
VVEEVLMNLSELRTDDYVRLNPKLKKFLGVLDAPQLWENEKYECFLQVSSYSFKDFEIEVEFECVKNCGEHMTHSFTQSEYEEIKTATGLDPLLWGENFEDFSRMWACEAEPYYNLEEDTAILVSLIRQGLGRRGDL